MASICVAGATGYLGRYVVKALKENGIYVRVLVRNKEKLLTSGPALEPSIDAYVDDVFVGDLTDPTSIQNCCEGMDYVFSSVGLTKPSGSKTFEQVDYHGNMNFLKEAERARVKSFMYIHVYNAEKIKGPATAAKCAFVDELRKSFLPSIVVKPTGYFSDMTEYAKMAQRGRVYLIGSGQSFINPIHGQDLARACVESIGSQTTTLDIGGPNVYSHEEIAQIAFHSLQHPVKTTRIPVWLIRSVIRPLKWISPPYYALGTFFYQVMTQELIAPSYGDHSLEHFFEEWARRNT